jgi:plastocyanin
MTLEQRSALGIAIVTALAIAAACSSSDSGPTGPTGDCILPTTSNFVDSAQGRVVIVGTSYNPAAIQVRKGMTVKWVYCERPNADPHTVTSDAGLWDSGLLSSNQTFSRAFAAVGSFAYHCIPHPEMTAVVTVVD